MAISYQTEPELAVAEFVGVLRRSTLAERRPVDDGERIQRMLSHATCIVTARRADGLLVGVSRALSDFGYCTYLSDLAVDVEFQGRGIGRQLINLTHDECGRHTTLVLLAAPKAQTYYPHIGMDAHPSCWVRRPAE